MEAEAERLRKELADAKAAVEISADELKKAKGEEKKKLLEADAKVYEASIKRATLEYTQIAHKMVNDELKVRLPDFFRLGYDISAKAMAGSISEATSRASHS